MSYGDAYSRSGDCSAERKEYLFVRSDDCGKIIGRGGSRIRDLQRDTRCRIIVHRDDEEDGTRRVELRGFSEEIGIAKEYIQQILEAGDDRGARMMQQQQFQGGGSDGNAYGEVIQVQSRFIGRIIGRGGSRIRELQDDTGCRINVSREPNSYGDTNVELIGSRSQRQQAMEAIDKLTTDFH